MTTPYGKKPARACLACIMSPYSHHSELYLSSSAQELSAATNHFERVTEYEQKVCYGSGSHNLAVQNQTSGPICTTNQCWLLSGTGGKWDEKILNCERMHNQNCTATKSLFQWLSQLEGIRRQIPIHRHERSCVAMGALSPHYSSNWLTGIHPEMPFQPLDVNLEFAGQDGITTIPDLKS